MRHLSVVLLLLVMGGGLVVIGGSVFAAQDATPTDHSGHPAVGSWEVDPQPDNPDNLPELATVSSDGTMLESTADGLTAHGVWAPTGDRTATVTFLVIAEEGFRLLIRADVEVSPDGQAFTGSYTNDFFDPVTGEWSGEIGPGTVEGTRLTLEAPGTPIASLEDVFGWPETTPAS